MICDTKSLSRSRCISTIVWEVLAFVKEASICVSFYKNSKKRVTQIHSNPCAVFDGRDLDKWYPYLFKARCLSAVRSPVSRPGGLEITLYLKRCSSFCDEEEL